MGDGNTFDMKTSSTLKSMSPIIVACFLILASAAFSPDVVVPEETYDQPQVLDAFSEGRAEVLSLLQAGNDDKACEDLAKGYKSEVEQAVNTAKALIDALRDEVSCRDLGQDEVSLKAEDKNHAATKKTNAENSVSQKKETKLELVSVTLGQVEEGGLAFIVSLITQKFETAMGELKALELKAATANVEHQDAVKAHQDAVVEAEKLKNGCLCEVQQAHKKAAAAAEDANSEANKKKWAKAGSMLCVLEDKADTNPKGKGKGKGMPINPKGCNQEKFPELVAPTTSDDVTTVACTAEEPIEEPFTPEEQSDERLIRTNKDIKPAVDAWIANPTEAEAKYGHISQWHTQQVTRMPSLFVEKTKFNEDISGWDVSAVTDMDYLFYKASSFNQDLSGWDVSALRRCMYMFMSANSFNQDLSGWDVSAVTDMRFMFFMTNSFNQDLSDWNVSADTNMEHMFRSAQKMENLPSWCERDSYGCL